MSQLRSAIGQATAFDPGELAPAELAAEITEALHAQQMLQVAVSNWTKNLAERGGHHDLGYSSPTALLSHQTGMSPGHAKQIIAMGNAVDDAPHAYAAWADGRVSTDQARHLFRAAEAVPDAYPTAEQTLVEIVEGLDAVDTRKAVEYWRQSVEGPGEIDPETQMIRRGLAISRTSGGMRRVDGWLTPNRR